MLLYDRTDIREGTDPTKSNTSRECMICHYLLFDFWFQFQYSVCNGCHDLSMLCLNITNIAIITVKKFGYHCIIRNIKNN